MSIPGVSDEEWESYFQGTFIGCAGPCQQGDNTDAKGRCPCPQNCYAQNGEEEQSEADTFAVIHFWGTVIAGLLFLSAIVGWVFF